MRILHVYKDYVPVIGGIEKHVRYLAEGQARAGHEVTVLACARDGRDREERRAGVRILLAGRVATVASMPISFRQPWLLRRERPDVVHVHSPYPLGELAAWLLGRARATVLTHHSDVIRQRRLLRIYGPLLRRVLARADRIIATSPRYIETSPWLAPVRDRCVVVPAGVDVARFAADPRPPRSPDRALELLFVGRLVHYKGLDVLLRALTHLPGPRLTVAGDGAMRAQWERLAGSLGLGGRVVFLGEVADEALPAVYADADVFVLPATNRAEAFGAVLVEAMAAGLPLVSTELGTGTSWVNQHDVTGLVVPAGDADALAAALRELDADRARLPRLGAAGRARARAELSLDRMVERVDLVYKEALDGKPS